MKNKLKVGLAILTIAGLTACSGGMNSTYKIKSENNDVVDKVPNW